MSKWFKFASVLVMLSILIALGACAAPAPQVVEKVVTQVVEKEKVVEKIQTQVVEVEKPVVQTQVVEKTIEITQVPVTNMVYNSYQSDPAPRQVDADIVKMFQEKYPNITVTHSTVAHEDFKQAIRAYLTSSQPPDVMTWFAGNRARFFIDKGQILDISDVWSSEGWNESYPKGFQALSTVDGKQYFVPTSYYWWAVYYNKKVFDKLGLEPPETWEEFLQVCETLKENGVTPIVSGTKNAWPAAAWFDYLNMRVNGPEFHINLMLGKEKYDDPRVKKTFEYWAELLEKGYFIEDAAAYDWQDVIPELVQEKAGMYLMGQFVMDSIPEENKADFDFFRFPIIDPNVPIGEDAPTDGYFAAANAPHPDAAKAFLAYLGSKEAQEYVAKELKRLPTNTEVDTSGFDPASQKGMELLKAADYIAQFYDRDTTPEMAEKGMAAFQAFWTDPTQIDTILADLEKERALIFAEE
jgi:multiple sugar transport system substrate-binding protein/raffinose/stachyose/melibiose transport system substrate-binding protein